MGMNKLFQRALLSSNNAVRLIRLEKLDLELGDERLVRPCEPTDAALSAWIDDVIRPNAFVTVLLPYTPGLRPKEDRRVRDHQFYLSLWTRKAEAALWGASTLRLDNYSDRCLFFFTRETIRQDWTHDGALKKFTHYHAAGRMPARPMLIERETGLLPTAERCRLLQAALVDASKGTPEPYAKDVTLPFSGADILVEPYAGPQHAKYIFKQLRPYFSEHWTESLEGPLLRDHETFILPHLPNRDSDPHVGHSVAAFAT